MAGNIKGITVEIQGNTEPLNKALKGVNKSSSDLKKELKDVEKALKLDPTNTVLLAQKQELLAKSINTTKEKLDTLKVAEEQAQSKFKEGKISEEQYRALQREVIKTESELRNLESRAKESNKELDKVTEASKKIGAVGEKMKSAGKGLSVGLTAPVVAFGAAGVAAFNSVDEAMDTIITKTGATGEAAEGLTDSFEEVAGRVPDDLTTVGEAIGEVNTQFGFLGKELEDNSQLILQFASINGTDVTSSSIAAKQAIEAYGLANSELNGVLDAVTKTAQDTGQSVDFLFEKATSGAPQIKALGLTFEEGTALIGNFEKAGVDSGASLSSLAKAQVSFAKDGKTMTQGLDDTIKSIMGATSETEALTIAAEVFGTKGASRMVDAIKRGTFNLKDFEDAGKNAAGTVKSTFDETVDPIDQAAIAANAAKLAMAKVGEAVQVALLPVMQKATELLKKLADWFKSLSPEMINTMLIVTGLVAAIGPLLIIFGTIATSVGSLLTLFGTVSGAIGILTGATVVATPAMTGLAGAITFITGPIGLTILAITALVAGFIYLWKNCEGFRNFWIGLWTGIKEITKVVVDSLIIFFTITIPVAWSSFISFITSSWNNFMNFLSVIPAWFGTLWLGVKTITESIWNGIKDFFANIWNDIVNTVMIIINPFIVGITNIFNSMKDGLVIIFEGLESYFIGIWNVIKNIFLGAILLIIDLCTGNFTKLKADAIGIFNNLKDAFNQIWQGITLIFTGALQAISGFLNLMWTGIVNIAILIWNGFKEFMSGLWAGIQNTAIAAWNGLKNAVVSIVTALVSGTINIFMGILNFFASLPGNLYNMGINMFNGLKDGIWSILSGLGGFIQNGFNGAISFLTGLPGLAYEWGVDFIQGLINGIGGMIGKVEDAVVGVANKIRSFLHFTVPDEGPLTDYETWMPDFMEGLSRGIEKSKYLVTNSIKGLSTDMSVGIKYSDDLEGRTIGTGTGTAGMSQQPKSITQNVTINSPTALSASETARQNKRALQELALGF